MDYLLASMVEKIVSCKPHNTPPKLRVFRGYAGAQSNLKTQMPPTLPNCPGESRPIYSACIGCGIACSAEVIDSFVCPMQLLATVLVHLFAAALHRNSSSPTLSETDPNMKLAGLYIRCQSPFAKVDDFVKRCQEIYHIDLMTVNDSLKNGLNAFLQERPSIRAILIGTRATDPNGGQSSFPAFEDIQPYYPLLFSHFLKAIFESC
jgi:hypothetical protein